MGVIMSTQREKIIKQAREILENSPKGIRYADLIRGISEALPDVKINTIHGTIWEFKQKIDKGEVKDVARPEKGLYILQKYLKEREYGDVEYRESEEIKEVKEEDFYKLFADYLVNELKRIPLVDCPLPDGAFYAFPNVSHYIKNNKIGIRDSVQLCEYLLKNFHVALVPGSAFGCDDCLRFSYATSMENIVEGVKRFKSGLASL